MTSGPAAEGPGRRPWADTRTFAAFGIAGYPVYWISGAGLAFTTTISVVAIGWITLQVSNSSFAVAAVFAARLLPSLILGIPLGSMVDRFDRRRVLVAGGLAGVVLLAVLAALAAAGQLGVGALLVLSLAFGVVDTFRGTASQAYAVDLAGPQGATNAIALSNLGGFVLGVVGSLTGGMVLDGIGATGAFLLAASVGGAASVILAAGPGIGGRDPFLPRTVPSFRRATSLLLRNRPVAAIALVVIVAEILGFSCAILFPAFARDVLRSDAAGLGALTAARYVGAIGALLLLARSSPTGGRWMLLATLGLGVGLVGFALSTSFALSLILLGGVGVASAGLDTLSQSLLQRSVGDGERGAAMGVWYFGIGFGPIGQLGLGGAATAIGAPAALAISGGLLALVALALSTVRAIRRL